MSVNIASSSKNELDSAGNKVGKSETRPLFSREYKVAFVVVTALFFIGAIPNNLNDVLIRQFMKSFQISRFAAGLVQSAFYLGYFIVSIPAAMVLRKFGYKTGLVTGLLLYGVGCFLFFPAAEIQKFGFFLFALFVIAMGLAFLETGASSFITQLGDPDTSERRLNFSQAFNPPGTIAGALIGTLFIFSGVELNAGQVSSMKSAGTYASYLHHETMRVITPYLVLSCVVFLFAVVLWKTRFPSPNLSIQNYPEHERGSLWSLLRRPHFVQGVLSQFFYVGAQVGTWGFLIQYVADYVHMPGKVGGYFLTGTLVIFAAGRWVATFLMKYVQPSKLMGIYSLVNVVLVGVAILLPGWTGLAALLLTSFFMSLMYPTNFALGVKDLGPDTTLGGSVLVMAIIGGAVCTPLIGWISQATKSMVTAMWVPLVCYLVVAYYGFLGSRVKNPRHGDEVAG